MWLSSDPRLTRAAVEGGTRGGLGRIPVVRARSGRRSRSAPPRSAVAGATYKLEERFFNPVIVHDADVAVVTFDYQFLENDVVQNEGLETWQLTRRDGKWKIVSVLWSFHEPVSAEPR